MLAWSTCPGVWVGRQLQHRHPPERLPALLLRGGRDPSGKHAIRGSHAAGARRDGGHRGRWPHLTGEEGALRNNALCGEGGPQKGSVVRVGVRGEEGVGVRFDPYALSLLHSPPPCTPPPLAPSPPHTPTTVFRRGQAPHPQLVRGAPAPPPLPAPLPAGEPRARLRVRRRPERRAAAHRHALRHAGGARPCFCP
jgi:hypothetical protein